MALHLAAVQHFPAGESKPAARIAELDGIRGIAILMVLIWHLVALGVPIDPSSRLFRVVFYLRICWSGVDLFFVLSGFLIGGILLDARGSPNFFKTFYARRAARILPLYFLGLVLFQCVVALHARGHFPNMGYLVADGAPGWVYWIFGQNIWSAVTGSWGPHWLGVTWSLAVEEQFYILLPLLVYFVPPRAFGWVIGALVCAAPLLRSVLFYAYEHGPYATCWLMPCRLDALGLGVLGALLLRSEKGAAFLRRNYYLVVVLFLVSASGVYFLDTRGQGIGTFHMATWGHTCLALMFWTILMTGVMRPSGVTARILRFRPLCRMGIIAYGLYLIHYPLQVWLHLWWFGSPPNIMGLERAVLTFVSFVLVVLLAELSWRFLEKPIVRLGHRLRY